MFKLDLGRALLMLLPTALLQLYPVAVADNLPAIYRRHGFFRDNLACGSADDPMSDIVNSTSIAAFEKATFRNYMSRSVSMTFENSNKSALSGGAADAEWKSFVPQNNGFLVVNAGNSSVALGISAFHAMHCLDTVRRILEVHYDVASPDSRDMVKGDHVYGSFYHVHHCLIYLREMVTCNADPALEHDIFYPNGTTIFQGDGTDHTCRDYRALIKISEQSDKAVGNGCKATSF